VGSFCKQPCVRVDRGRSVKSKKIGLRRSIHDIHVDMVLLDNVDAVFRLITHLIENGYRRIGALFGEMSTTGRERQLGYE